MRMAMFMLMFMRRGDRGTGHRLLLTQSGRQKLLKIYDRLSKAEAAREALLASGFPSEKLHLSSTIDEAGPVEGNFVLEYKDAVRDNDKSFLDSLIQRADPNEGLGRREVAWCGSCLLTVEAEDAEQLRRVRKLIEDFGGAEPDNA